MTGYRKLKFGSVGAIALLLMLVLLAACGDSTTAPISPTTTTAVATTNSSATTNTVTTAVATASTTAGATMAAATAPKTTTAATGTTATTTNANTTGASTTAAGTTATDAAGCTKLNLNSLTETQLTAAIPNFPNRMVREFLEYRPYSSIQQFRKEIGKYVEAKQVTEWEKYVYVPIKANDADNETLKQIPGVTDTIAANLTKARPFASNDAFLKALGSQVTSQQLTSASCYIGS